jgi:hypothetical protein
MFSIFASILVLIMLIDLSQSFLLTTPSPLRIKRANSDMKCKYSRAPLDSRSTPPTALKMADASNNKEDGVEPKYVIALVVFLLACVYDKMVMHGGF